jgi:MoaA/NifB/PqqE/SkfB family radical SAM enzyme
MFFRSKNRQLRALQVEVSSRCTRHCALCPRSALSDRWQDGDMSDEVWKSIEPAFPLAEHIHLQGWGEPLLHPSLPQMARAAKNSGATVGITTNGDLLESALEWILDERVDLLTLSVAGNSESHARLRGGSPLGKVLDAVHALNTHARKSKSRIKTQISYLLTRENAVDMPGVVELAAKAGVSEFFVIHLDLTPTQLLLNQAAFDQNGLAPGIGKCLDDAEKTARRRIKFRGPTKEPEETLACALNPARFVFVAWDGRVGPCVNLLFPISGAIPRWDFGGSRQVEQKCYGGLPDSDLNQILTGDARRAFCEPFIKRLDAEVQFWKGYSGTCGLRALKELEVLDSNRSKALGATPFPNECQGCHKIMGW